MTSNSTSEFEPEFLAIITSNLATLELEPNADYLTDWNIIYTVNSTGSTKFTITGKTDFIYDVDSKVLVTNRFIHRQVLTTDSEGNIGFDFGQVDLRYSTVRIKKIDNTILVTTV